MKIAFYLTNKCFADKDCSDVLSGNPGIGGTHYAMLLLSKLLADMEWSVADIESFVFAEAEQKLPSGINTILTPNLDVLSKAISDNHVDLLVVNKIGKDTLDKRFFDAIASNEVKVIIWAHCFIPYFDLLSYARNNKVAKIVAVGREQLMTWCDHSVFNKSTYIYNICNYPEVQLKPYSERKNRVVYIGSIVSLKGLHWLTRAWPAVKSKVPDAEMYVIGSGKLYNKDAKLGKYGIAEYFYEKELLKPILDTNGRIDPSVHFCGIMGPEKFDILNEAKVGVPNPGGLTETFGFTAVEMQLSGCQVTTVSCPGYLDTVENKKNLYSHPKELADYIEKLLKEPNYNSAQAISYIKNLFSPEVVVPQWIKLFTDVYNDNKQEPEAYTSLYRDSFRKQKNSKFQKVLPCLPSLMLYQECWNSILYVIEKLLHIDETIHKIVRRKILKK